ncbi:heterokaryon incompatibility protein-domain-containing protein [Nemania sp. FL0916]|nr:heterokaryon incompatibility protein-domain-containing protein [Nemania sp. FL0916]
MSKSKVSDVYATLRVHPWQTRIIRLQPGKFGSSLRAELFVADIIYNEGLAIRGPWPETDEQIEYDALSYTWGAPEFPRSLTCNTVTFPITENLYQALQHIRDKQNEHYLWIDAICINQGDNEEKAHQVQNMLGVYLKARSVIGWMGMAGQHTERAIDLAVACLIRNKRKIAQKGDWVLEDVCKGFLDLYERQWLQRVWVQQEIFAARQLVIRCGHLEIPSEALAMNPSELLQLVEGQWSSRQRPSYTDSDSESSRSTRSDTSSDDQGQAEGSDSEDGIPIPTGPLTSSKVHGILERLNSRRIPLMQAFQVWLSSDREMRPAWSATGQVQLKKPPPLAETLFQTSKLSVTNQRDRIYGVLGLTQTPSHAGSLQDNWEVGKIAIDYNSSVREAYTAATLWLIEHYKSFNILFFANSQPICDELDDLELPRWVIDWRRPLGSLGAFMWEYLCQDFNMQRDRGFQVDYDQFIQDNGNAIQRGELVVQGHLIPKGVFKDYPDWDWREGREDEDRQNDRSVDEYWRRDATYDVTQHDHTLILPRFGPSLPLILQAIAGSGDRFHFVGVLEPHLGNSTSCEGYYGYGIWQVRENTLKNYPWGRLVAEMQDAEPESFVIV